LLGSSGQFATFVKQITRDNSFHFAPLRRLVSPYILRRLKTDKSIISDLPEKTEMKVFCGLTPAQAKLYQQSAETLAKDLEATDGIQRRGLVLAYLMRFKQICNHPDQLTKSGNYVPSSSAKFTRLAELCEEIASRGEKALVFTQFRELTDPLESCLATVFGRHGLVLHGGTPVKERQNMVQKFQRDDGPPFFVLSLKAGGTGLTLTAASHVIHFDRWWNPAVENQATDRAFRIGQKRNVLVHKFITTGTLEEKIDALITEKQDTADAILTGGAEKSLTEMNNAELLDFVRLSL
jgi:non-specific serine/threonine protein kinase